VVLVSFLKKHKNNSCKNCIVLAAVLKVMHFLLSYIQCHAYVGYVQSCKEMRLLWFVGTKTQTYVITHSNAKAILLFGLRPSKVL
jgi:hypothetical protein